jgi:hypothetical protein
MAQAAANRYCGAISVAMVMFVVIHFAHAALASLVFEGARGGGFR